MKLENDLKPMSVCFKYFLTSALFKVCSSKWFDICSHSYLCDNCKIKQRFLYLLMQSPTLTAGLSVLLCAGLRKPDSGLTEPIFQGQKCNSSWMSVWHFFFFFFSKQLRTQWHRHETSQGSNSLISKLRREAAWVVLAAALPVTRKPRTDSHRQLSTL